MQVESGLEATVAKWSGRVPPLDLSSVSVCPRETEHRWSSSTQRSSSNSPQKKSGTSSAKVDPHPYNSYCFGTDGLPIDPREWSRAHVWTWLVNMAKSEGLEPNPELVQKFPMNGKALCLMTLDMYLTRVPMGGKMLYRDFRVRLARALSLS